MPRQASSHIDDPVAVGRRLREARQRAGLTQSELSFPGCSAAYISRIEAGERVPSLQLLRELASRLGLSEDQLALGSERSTLTYSRELLEAEVALRLDETDTAVELYRAALERAVDDRERARALAGLGQAAFRRGDPPTAIEHLEDAVERFSAVREEDPAVADTLGRAYALTGDLDGAIGVFERALASAEERGDEIEMMRFAVLLSNAMIDTGRFTRARELLERIQRVVEHSRDPILRARLYWSTSRLYGEQGNPHLGARFARQALEILQQTEHEYYTARAYQLLAYTENDRGRPEVALELLHEGWPLIAESGNPLEKAQFRLEEARALAALGRHEEAAELAMGVSGEIGEASPEDAGRGYAVLAKVFATIGDRARAIELYELAADLLGRNPNHFLVTVYAELAELLKDEGRKDEALAALEKAVRLRLAQGEPVQPSRNSSDRVR